MLGIRRVSKRHSVQIPVRPFVIVARSLLRSFGFLSAPLLMAHVLCWCGAVCGGGWQIIADPIAEADGQSRSVANLVLPSLLVAHLSCLRACLW